MFFVSFRDVAFQGCRKQGGKGGGVRPLPQILAPPLLLAPQFFGPYVTNRPPTPRF